jgi:hypothetical protein
MPGTSYVHMSEGRLRIRYPRSADPDATNHCHVIGTLKDTAVRLVGECMGGW